MYDRFTLHDERIPWITIARAVLFAAALVSLPFLFWLVSP